MFSKELFGQRLKEVRLKSGETQQELAVYLGCAKNSISEIEGGKRTTTAEKIALICQRYGISSDYLLGLSNELNKKEDV